MKTKLGLLFSIFTVMCVGFSSCKEDSKDNPSPGNGELNGHEYVDLGLPGHVMWATCNVGASRPEDYGLYFAWGETKGYAKGESHTFDWTNYTMCNGTPASITKYCSSDGNKMVLDAADDAATVIMGSEWCMPTKEQIEELIDGRYTHFEWTSLNGVPGFKVSSRKNGKSIFLPAMGKRDDNDLIYDGNTCFFWSRTRSNYPQSAVYLELYSDIHDWYAIDRYNGLNVRAVRK